MSLNFVSTSVLTSTDGVSHDTETDLRNSSSGPTEYVKPLFEQLRKNAQDAQDQYDEITRRMRGAKTLDEEDVAYIQSLEERKMQVLNKTKKQEEEEVQLFHATRLEKSMISSADKDFEKDVTNTEKPIQVNAPSSLSSILMIQAPKLLKKRRRRPESNEKNTAVTEDGDNINNLNDLSNTKKMKSDDVEKKNKEEKPSNINTSDSTNNPPSSLGALLAYGTDSDSD